MNIVKFQWKLTLFDFIYLLDHQISHRILQTIINKIQGKWILIQIISNQIVSVLMTCGMKLTDVVIFLVL